MKKRLHSVYITDTVFEAVLGHIIAINMSSMTDIDLNLLITVCLET